ncbi:transcription termination/antitermination protein NusG [Methylobacterium sp. Leaf118]|uniref:transcription termination/antitermination protein NusG n=1 Tax=Methylobacterium sp. Leaf118 TaxID=2876562 RepID=UPI001E287220|nr:transcription termination/antitermination NusG family protein [Methylobacterium sp. Leaf118]
MTTPYEAKATPQHSATLPLHVLAHDEALGLGERCRWPRPAACPDDAPERIGRFDPGLTYYAASVAPSGERRASEWLERAGYSPFVPSRIVERRHAGRKTLVRRPVFPGYAFVGKSKAQSWHGILREPGVVSLVAAGSTPIVLPPWQMRLLAAADEFDAYEAPKPHASFHEGQAVRVVGAMWEGLIGQVMRAPESRRIAILLDARGKKLKMDVDVDLLKAA